MGNSQTRTATADGGEGGAVGGLSSSSFRASMKSRRGSRVKVFGLLGQKKPSKEPTTPTTPSSSAPPQFGVTNVANAARTSTSSCIEIIDEEERAALHQGHDAVIRQLEFEQMEIRNKAKQQKKKANTKANAKSNISTKNEPKPPPAADNRASTLSAKKRVAPQPPLATTTKSDQKLLAKATTPTNAIAQDAQCHETKAQVKAAASQPQQQNHREFIERLIDSTITLENIDFDISERDDNAQEKEGRTIEKPVLTKTKQSAGNVNLRESTRTATVVPVTMATEPPAGATQRKSSITKAKTTNDSSCTTLPTATGNENTTTTTPTVVESSLITPRRDTESDESPLKEHRRQQSLSNVTHERNESIFKESFCDHDDIDDVFHKHMATPLRMTAPRGGAIGSAGGGGGARRHSLCTLNDDCDIVMLRDLSSSSDSLFTDPLSPQSASAIAPAGSPGEPCNTATDNDEDADADEDDDDVETATAKKTNPNQTHTKASYTAVQLPATLHELRVANANARGPRPLSEISIASGDTSGILSPTTARAILELRKRHQADKLSLLSVAKTTYLEILPTELPTESSPESTDEQMAMHLGKKLAQVLSGGGTGSGSGVGAGTGANANVVGGLHHASGAGTPGGSPLPDNGNYCSAAATPTTPSTNTNELFNIAKAKKIELPSLSSRLVASAAASLDTGHTANSTGSTDAKHLPTLHSTSTPSSSSLHSNTGATASAVTAHATAATTSTETQSTVIISFKSSQTPVQSQAITSAAAAASAAPPEETVSQELPPPNNNDNAEPTVLPLASLSNSLIGATSQLGSPLPPGTPRNNVLKKVASFTVEKAAAGSASKINNGDSNSSMAGLLESNGLRRSSFVPEKLSFAAYEKFEGQMLMKWFISSLQLNGSHLSEQDVSVLTLQYCNNLINVGVLKQISEKRDDMDAFSPFHMYQWTHTEAPTTSQPHTPGKLDKVHVWPYCSTPAGEARVPKNKQVDSAHPDKDKSIQQILRRRLLSCSTITEVHTVVNELLVAGEPLRRPSKRCIQLSDLLNASETTIYHYDKNTTDVSSGIESGMQEAGVQTDELSLAIQQFVCEKCGGSEDIKRETTTCEKEVQVCLTEESIENRDSETKAATPAPPPPPPPPPPPFPGMTTLAPPPHPPPPPPPCGPLPPPPPPPPIGSGAPPPPPAPPCNNASSAPLSSLNTSNVPPPPPPGPPKTPTATTPAPLPNPTEGGWFHQTNTLRKTAVNPPKPMKPLYWTRIVTQPPPPPKPSQPLPSAPSDETDSSATSSPDDPPIGKPQTPKEIWQEIDETCLDNIDEFTELFSREAVMPVTKPKVKTEVRVRPTKVLDSKRSQNVGIISRSSHVDFCEIEHAIYHVDTSVVSLETLQQIINIKATNEELELIKEAAQSEVPLDYPEQFLLKISQISMSTERISCIVFMAEFEESATLIERKLEVVMQLSQFLMESEELKLIFAIILTLGNYMNGGNRQRGQADGFTLEILSKLKDVKSKESQTTLLHFIVRTYIGRKRKEGVQLLEIPLPIPEPSDVERANQADFDEVKRQINELNRQLKSSKNITEKVISSSTPQNMEPFKSKMEEFIEHATTVVEKLYKELDDCRDIFIETMKFYHYSPKTGTIDSCTPKNFFEHWTNFTNDFKDIMKKEIAVLWNELLKKSKDVQSRKTVKTTKVKPGGLKERIKRLNKK